MAIASSLIAAGLTAAAVAGSAAVSMKNAHDQKKAVKAQQAAASKNVYNQKAETNKAATQEAESNKRRVLTETDTIKTSALGNTGTTETKKKTLLGG